MLAAAAVDPVGGEGIGLALWSAHVVSRLLGGAPRLDEETLRDIQRRLALAYRARLRVRRPACRLAAASLMHPGLIRAIWPAVRLAPSLTLRPAYHLTGKPLRPTT